MKLLLIVLALLILRDVLAYVFKWGNDETFVDLMENARHNREIDREWERNGRPIIEKTVGWRPDPIYKNDGFRFDPSDGLRRGHTYSRLIRGGTPEYRAKFQRDIEESKK